MAQTKTVEQKKAELRERGILRTMESCRHFTGVQHEECKAGIRYNSVNVIGPIPCIPFNTASPRNECELKSCWTREEAETNQAELERRSVEGLRAAFAAHTHAGEKGFKKGNGGQGSLKCPVCQEGTLRYGVASYNGHMHAACTKAGCVSWME
jgi:hypothetical protein